MMLNSTPAAQQQQQQQQQQQTPPTGDNASEVSNSAMSRKSLDARSHDGASTDGRTRRKLKKSPTASPRAAQTWEPPPEEKESKSLFGGKRRQSMLNPKVPQGARPMVGTQSQPSTVNGPPSQPRAFMLTSKVPRSRQSSISNVGLNRTNEKAWENNNASTSDSAVPQFLPPVNFDDLHESITLGDFGDLSFIQPSEVAPKKQLSVPNLPKPDTSIRKTSAEQLPRMGEMPIHSRNNSFVRPTSNTQRQSSNTSIRGTSSGFPPTTSQAQRPQRQSYFPMPPPSSADSKAPRKSVGPGVLSGTSSDYSFLNDTPARLDKNKADATRTRGIRDFSGSKPSRLSLAPTTEHGTALSARNAKAKSMQAPPILPVDLQYPPGTPENPRISTTSSVRSPGRDTLGGSSTSSKRASMMPGHATGLGARTVSPTDARRAKRLSLAQSAPPMPSTPTAPLPEPPVPRAAAESPPIPVRKSVTPSSSRTTPEHNRKSYSSGISISSNTSFNSLKNSAAATRTQQNSVNSRLPMLKPRTDTGSTTAGEEVVPPVPAIPKGFDSPKTEPEGAAFLRRKSSLIFDSLSVRSASTLENTSAPSNEASDREGPRSERTPKQRHVGARRPEMAEEERAAGIQDGRRTMQPLRLPLTIPMSDKERSAPEDFTSITPPPRKGPPKTPTTPMTASRSNFFGRNRVKDEPRAVTAQMRSSSSHHGLRHDPIPAFRPPSSSASSGPGTIEFRLPCKTTSPFISSSLPKSSGEFTRRTPNGDRSASNVSGTARPSRLTGPRVQTMAKPTRAEPAYPQHAPSDTEATSFGTSLRRKLSMSRRRSFSKTEGVVPSQLPDSEAMPPPKLPASATLTKLQPAPSPTQKTSFLHSRRKSSAPEAYARQEQKRSEASSTTAIGTTPSQASTEHKPQLRMQAKASESNIRRFSSNGSLSNTKQPQGVDTTLDKDDRYAEEEMMRLAGKRKKTEAEARELDELRRRAVPRERVSPAQALRAARLNIYERGEIIDFKDIFFCGTADAKKFAGNLEAENSNFGYDDDRGDYNIVFGDHLAYRYEVVDILGKGSFGQVVRCVDHKTGGLVAIKIIRNKKRFHQQALVEVNILQKLREWDPQNKYSMVSFVQSFYFRGHLCISTELLGMNLYEFIKIHDFRGFSLKLIRRFTKQVLNSLVLLKSRRVIHCDLKPENILLTHPARSEIKVIDFGSSCMENEKVYTYIQSRFYRSPEVILGMSYGMPIDMWSLGCILAELLTGYPIFPGENEQEQLACIMEIFGPPDKHLIEKSTRKKLFFDSLGKPRTVVSSKGKRRRPSSKSLQQSLKCDDEAFLDFLTRCLRWDPERRMKPDEAIYHEFITGIRPSAAVRSLRAGPPSTTNGVSTSPIKRFNSMHAPSGSVRPLPEPPATALKTSTTPRTATSGPSPIKPVSKRYSTTTATASTISSARKGPGPPPTTTLPKLGGQRSSGRPDLASAGAAAAMKTRQ